jgi:hypothetical protein
VNIILSGVVGSTAYGLATPESDVDRLGIFAHNTTDMYGLTAPPETYVDKDPLPDKTLHEAAKACRLMLQGNPTVLEILWLESYEESTLLGEELIDIRGAFLTAKRVRDAYLGYATQQFRRFVARGGESFAADIGPKRVTKHARHLWRLVNQGTELYGSGNLRIRLTDEEVLACRSFSEMVTERPELGEAFMADAEERFNSMGSALRDEPNLYAIETWLHRVRSHYNHEEDLCPLCM